MTSSRKPATPAPPAGRSPSLSDVASLAGVSSGTVSRALSRPDMISAATRDRVLAAVERLGYVANGAARALAMRRTMTVGAIVPRFGGSSFPTMIQALETTLAGQGYTLLLAAPEHRHSHEAAILRTMLERGVDALALLSSEHPREVFAMLANSRIPFVMMWAQASDEGTCIGFDEPGAAGLLVDHLADLGHRRLGFIGGRIADNERARRRFQGLMRALARRGLELMEEATIETDYGFQEGYDAMSTLLSRRMQASAVVCGNDYLAAGALSALDRAGIAVPESLSVASFNDNDFASFLHPPLTTVRLPIREIGERSGQYLMARLRGRSVEPMAPLPIQLMRRSSTGPMNPDKTSAA
jgi:LacI family transcriptional regulator